MGGTWFHVITSGHTMSCRMTTLDAMWPSQGKLKIGLFRVPLREAWRVHVGHHLGSFWLHVLHRKKKSGCHSFHSPSWFSQASEGYLSCKMMGSSSVTSKEFTLHAVESLGLSRKQPPLLPKNPSPKQKISASLVVHCKIIQGKKVVFHYLLGVNCLLFSALRIELKLNPPSPPPCGAHYPLGQSAVKFHKA